jgi:uncharacterized membrane protein YtjA (UPF0391 family)
VERYLARSVNKETTMLGWALTFLVIALIAAALGFGGIAGAAAGIAKIIFFVFLALLLVSLVMHVARGTAPNVGSWHFRTSSRH